MELFLQAEFLGIKLFDEDFFELVIRSMFNLFIVYAIVKTSYLKEREFNSHVFSFFVFSVVIFFVCYLMSNVKLDFGVAFGLFAIFSILRYRTDPIPIREMTYLFIVMGVSVLNALSNKKVSYAELLFTNFAIVFFIYFLERYGRRAQRESLQRQEYEARLLRRDILFNNIDHIRPENKPQLTAALKQLTGLDIQSIHIQKINLQDETMQVRVMYLARENEA